MAKPDKQNLHNPALVDFWRGRTTESAFWKKKLIWVHYLLAPPNLQRNWAEKKKMKL